MGISLTPLYGLAIPVLLGLDDADIGMDSRLGHGGPVADLADLDLDARIDDQRRKRQGRRRRPALRRGLGAPPVGGRRRGNSDRAHLLFTLPHLHLASQTELQLHVTVLEITRHIMYSSGLNETSHLDRSKSTCLPYSHVYQSHPNVGHTSKKYLAK